MTPFPVRAEPVEAPFLDPQGHCVRIEERPFDRLGANGNEFRYLMKTITHSVVEG